MEEETTDAEHVDTKEEETPHECKSKEELLTSKNGQQEVNVTQSEDIAVPDIPTIQTVHILPTSPGDINHHEGLSPSGDLEAQPLDAQVISDAEIMSPGCLSVSLPQAVVLTTSVLSNLCPNALSPVPAGSDETEEEERQESLLVTKEDSEELLIPKVEPAQAYIGLTTTVSGIHVSTTSDNEKLITTSAGEGIVVTTQQTGMCYLRQIFDHDQVTSQGEMPTLTHGVTTSELPELQQCKWQDCCQHFLSLNDLVHHVNECHIHFDKDSEYRCRWEGCNRNGKGFNARYKMLIHMRTHTGERPHRCHYDSCGKSFSRLENLKIHQRSHTGERPYICPIEGCDKRYSNSSDRFKHTRTHYERKPYHCRIEGCEKRYTDPSSLRKHLKTHHGQELSVEAEPD